MKKTHRALLVIVILAGVLRFVGLSTNPPSLTWDEAAWGYNSYTLSIDGKDEFGRFLPVDFLESFGDFKPPVYAYLGIVPVKIFGLTEFATRFPSAFFGTLTVLITYFLTTALFFKSEKKNVYGLLAAFLLAVSPWHINLSRGAYEANVASFFLVFAILSFLYFVLRDKNKRVWLITSAVFFVLATYTFNTARIVGPLLVISLTIGFWRELWKEKRTVIVAGVVGMLLLLPSVQFYLSPQASLRFREVNIFSDLSVIERLNQQVDNDSNSPLSKILHNRRAAFTIEFVKHYLDNFTPQFLFIKGDGNPKFSTQDLGQLYIWELPFLIVGILYLFKKREGHWWIVPSWLLLAVIPAATARETPHALRIETTLPMFQILVAYGVFQLYEKVSSIKYQVLSIKLRSFIYGFFLFFSAFSFLYYIHGYYVEYSYRFSHEWQYGYKESIEYVERVKNDYDEIRVTNSLGRPYIYYLFYTKTDPDEFRKSAVVRKDVFGFITVERFGKYVFPKDINREEEKGKNVLYISSFQDTPKKNIEVLKTFSLVDGRPVLTAYVR